VTVTHRILSLGAGVQSSTLYLMAAAGEFGDERPEVAVFSDTQWEPAGVYEWLARLPELAARLGSPMPIQVVTAGSVRESVQYNAGRFVTMPLYVENKDGSIGMIRRQCTKEFKIVPVTQAVRRHLGLAAGQRVPKGTIVEQWMGISLDEASRMRDADEPWRRNRYPLVEREMTRAHCLQWLAAHDIPAPPKSACIGCPFHSDRQWRELRDHDPVAWADAVDFDRGLRDGRMPPFKATLAGKAFLHRSGVPLEEVDLRTAEERGQVNLWENECEGMCGV
jgi:hypothetical protein